MSDEKANAPDDSRKKPKKRTRRNWLKKTLKNRYDDATPEAIPGVEWPGKAAK